MVKMPDSRSRDEFGLIKPASATPLLCSGTGITSGASRPCRQKLRDGIGQHAAQRVGNRRHAFILQQVNQAAQPAFVFAERESAVELGLGSRGNLSSGHRP